MAQDVRLSDETFERLQRHAVPLVDSIETVVNRLLDFYEEKKDPANLPPRTPSGKDRIFDPMSPPDLTHTRIHFAHFDGEQLSRSECKWNAILHVAIRQAFRQGRSLEDTRQLIIVNCVAGRKEDEGYKYLSDIGISVQGQDANAAWKAIYHIVKQIGCSIEVRFAWRSKEDSAFPGASGIFIVADR